MISNDLIISQSRIERTILFLRGQKVMLDSDLAALYGIPTKVLKQAVKRNLDRFPSDFMFELTAEEKIEVVTNCDHLAKLKFSPYLPYAFTEHGALMLASVLNSPKAVQVSVQIVRTFIRLRELLATHKDLARKLEDMEKKYDHNFKIVFDAIRQLLSPPEKPKRPIGFRVEEPLVRYRTSSGKKKRK
ncbi:MAG: ORF6N domain-containing protein [Bacteroidota bacterium]|nr:ORF6N domain-containing protein [Bacteroidota bacterium]